MSGEQRCAGCGNPAVVRFCQRCEEEIERGEPYGVPIPFEWPRWVSLWRPWRPYDFKLRGL